MWKKTNLSSIFKVDMIFIETLITLLSTLALKSDYTFLKHSEDFIFVYHF